jgi:hypothetical protein
MKYLVMVCHTEPWWRNGSWQFFDEIFDGFQRAWDMATKGSKRPRVTFCMTLEAVADKDKFFTKLQADGHEIGVHSHLPESQRHQHSYSGDFAYKVDRNGVLNQDLAAKVTRSRITEADLGTPKVHVSGMFTFRDTTACILEEAGLTVDCSLMPGILGKHDATGDFILCDNRRRTSPAVYRLSRTDHCQPGNSNVIELPVWGHINADDDQQCIIEIAEESSRTDTPAAHLWESYWRSRGAFENTPSSGSHIRGKPEAIQMFFHYWDFIHPCGRANADDIQRLGCFLSKWGQVDDCGFATASKAADAWMWTGTRENGETNSTPDRVY